MYLILKVCGSVSLEGIKKTQFYEPPAETSRTDRWLPVFTLAECLLSDCLFAGLFFFEIKFLQSGLTVFTL